MTRKRFVKLLMSRGFDRNFCNYYTRSYAPRCFKSYQEIWDDMNWVPDYCEKTYYF